MTASAVPESPAQAAAVTPAPAERAWPNALWAFYVSRIVVWVAAMLAFALSPPAQGVVAGFDPSALTHPFHATLLNRLIAPGVRYDSVWYLGIAQHGYFTDQAHAFFPLYPLAIKALAWVIPNRVLAGLLISMGCFAGALTLLHRLARLDLEPRVAQLAVWLLALFPMSLFFSAIYTEAIFTLVSIWAIYAARTERWWLAGLMAGLASAARSDGIVVFVPILWIYLWGPRPGAVRPDIDWSTPMGPLSRVRPDIGWLALAPVGLIAYLAYCAASGAGLTAPFHAAAYYWGRSFAGPFAEIVIAVRHLVSHDLGAALTNTHVKVFYVGDPLNWTWSNVIDVIWLVPVGAALVAAWRHLPRVYTVYTVLLILASASNPSPLEPMMSFARYVMPAFPLFLGAAAVLADRPRARWSVLGFSSLALAFFSGVWGMWGWVA